MHRFYGHVKMGGGGEINIALSKTRVGGEVMLHDDTKSRVVLCEMYMHVGCSAKCVMYMNEIS